MSQKGAWVLGLMIFFPFVCKPLWVEAGVKVMPPAAHRKDASLHIKIENNRLSVDAHKIPLSKILSIIEKKTGIAFQVDSVISKRPIDMGFKNILLLEGVRLLVHPSNLFCVYSGEGDKLKKVIILPVQAESKVEVKRTDRQRILSEKKAAREGNKFQNYKPPRHSPPSVKNHRSHMHPPAPPGAVSMERPPLHGPGPMSGGGPPGQTNEAPSAYSDERPPIDEPSDGPVQ